MEELTQRAIAFSNGKWVSATAMLDALNVRSAIRNPLFRLNKLSGSVSFQVQYDRDGRITLYRAYPIEGKSFIELAKMRKAMGVLSGIESIKLGRTA